MWLLLLVLACGATIPGGADSTSLPGDDSGEPDRDGCQDPSNWALGGNGRYCEGTCGDQGIVCADTMSPPRCRVNLAQGGDEDCDIPPEVEDEALCQTAIVTTCAALIVP